MYLRQALMGSVLALISSIGMAACKSDNGTQLCFWETGSGHHATFNNVSRNQFVGVVKIWRCPKGKTTGCSLHGTSHTQGIGKGSQLAYTVFKPLPKGSDYYAAGYSVSGAGSHTRMAWTRDSMLRK